MVITLKRFLYKINKLTKPILPKIPKNSNSNTIYLRFDLGINQVVNITFLETSEFGTK